MAITFNAAAYGRDVEQILTSGVPALTGLVASATPTPGLLRDIVPSLFADSAHPPGALAGLWLYFDCFDESHRVSQGDPSVEGSLWHGIAHRREPAYANAGYWFRLVQEHALFPQILKRVGTGLGPKWDPLLFIDYCEDIAQKGGEREAWALKVQRVEWEILFDYCARKRSV